ncbi:MAG TPA: hypothetical protein VK923_15425 [Euzebyales bacterium]|nr:hypothetical protein [Euzebyales bacterium]
MQYQIADEHAEVLREVLDAALRELRYEISDTDNSRYKQELREREEALRALMAPLGGPLPDAPRRSVTRR